MAGIGFEIRKILERDTYSSMLRAYAYAGVISSGPWILSIVGILIVGIMSASVVVPSAEIIKFQVTVTWIIMLTLILTGVIQLGFTRFISDRIFEKNPYVVTPNFLGMMLLVLAASGTLAIIGVFLMFPAESNFYRVLALSGFVIQSGIWVSTIFLSGMKRFKPIVSLFALGYGITIVTALLLRSFGTEGLLLGFVIGQFILLIGMILITMRGYPSDQLVSFDFLRRGAMFPSLLAIGFIYNLGIWVDKLIFWFAQTTSEPVVGPFRASIIYDTPIFLAYLAIIPGMAVFLVRMETDFVECFERFYSAVRDGASLEHIRRAQQNMVFSIRQGLAEIVKIQTIAAILVIIAGSSILSLLGISRLYLPLLYIVVIGAGLQVVLLGILNVFFYIDKRRVVLWLTAAFLVLNAGLSWVTIELGAPFYGYGFAIALLVTVLIGIEVLEQKLASLRYETFMLQ